MELFNKLASNNTTEGGDIGNEVMRRIQLQNSIVKLTCPDGCCKKT